MMSRINGYVKAFKRNRQGVAAVEFGLIAPIALLLLLGTIELGRALVTARRFYLVTSVISDLVSREHEMPDPPAAANPAAEMAAIASAALTMWKPYDPTTLQFQVLQIRDAAATATKIAPGTIYVDWSYPMFGAPAVTQCSAYPGLSATLIPQGQALVIVKGTYTYKPLFTVPLSFATAANWKWAATSSHSPRQFGCVDYNQTNCVSVCE